MIAEIAVNRPEKAKTLRAPSKPVAQADFIAETVKHISEMSLEELESRVPMLIQRREQDTFVLGGMLERIRRAMAEQAQALYVADSHQSSQAPTQGPKYEMMRK